MNTEIETRNQKHETNGSPLISVIVPVYNAEKTLRQCVDRILGQDYRDFELLLIDDGSMDSSPAICDEYAAKDLRVKVFHKINGGVSSARNLGLENAHGYWITFIDADDYITECFFYGIDRLNNDLLIVPYIWSRHGNNSFDERLINYELVEKEDICSFLNEYLTTAILRGPCAKFYKRELMEGIRFDEAMKVAEDAYFVHHYLLKCERIYCLHNSRYIVNLADVGAEVKYKSTTEYAIQSLNKLFGSFKVLVDFWGINKFLFNSYLIYFKAISREDWKKKPSKWYRDPDIRKMYGYIWDSLPFKDKVKYKVVQMLSVFYR